MADEERPNTPDAEPPKPAAEEPKSVQDKVSELANRWLEDRFGLKVDGGLRLPETESIKDFGMRAEQFVRSFFKGFLEKSPEELAAGGAELPSATELVTRVVAKTTGTVSNAFNDYLRENAVDQADPERPVTIDGRFLMRHGLALIGRVVQDLGGAFAQDTKVEHIPEPHPKVDVKVDVGNMFKSLLRPLEPSAATEPPPDPTSTPPSPEDPT